MEYPTAMKTLYNKADGAHKHNVEQKMPGTKKNILYNSI